jgi:hypothetical protein
MANGAAALRLVPEIAPLETTDKLAEAARALSFDPQPGGAENWVAWVEPIVVALVDVAMNAAQEIAAGGLGPRARSQGGDLIGALTVIREKLGAREFAAAVHRVRPRRSTPMNAGMADDIIMVVTDVATQAALMN